MLLLIFLTSFDFYDGLPTIFADNSSDYFSDYFYGDFSHDFSDDVSVNISNDFCY